MRRTKLVWLSVSVFLLLVPLAARGGFYLNLLIIAQIYVLYVLGWDFLAGVGGEICGGQALAFGGAAYLAGFFGLAGLAPPLVLVCTPLAALVLGLAVGLFSFRLTGVYLLLVTLVLAEGAYEVSLSAAGRGPGGLRLGGENGLPVAGLFSGAHSYLFYYYLTLLLAAAGIGGLLLLRRSLTGTRMLAVKSDPLAARSIGLNPGITRTAAFGISFGLSGLAGTLYAQFTGAATPGGLSLELSFAAVMLSMLGGTGTILGPAVVTYLVNVVFGWFWLPSYLNVAVYSIVVIVVARFYPGGMRLPGRRMV